MKNKKILMLLRSNFPPDIRVEKEAFALIKARYDVHLLCLQYPGDEREGTYKGIKIHREVPYTYPFKPLKYFFNVLEDIFYRSGRWEKAIQRLHKRENFAALHAHDLPMAPIAVAVKKRIPALKVVLDFHENYPAARKEWARLNTGLKNKIIGFLNRYHKLFQIEKSTIQSADSVIAVVDEMKERIIFDHKTDSEKITVVSNTEGSDFTEYKFEAGVKKYFTSKYTALYIGGFGAHRGLDTAIEGMQYVKNKNIHLLLVGADTKNTDYNNHLKNTIEKSGVGDRVTIVPRQESRLVPSFIERCDIGLVPHGNNPHTNNTIPHKLFQYMLLGTPVLVSDCPPLKRVVEESHSGLVFKAGDAADFGGRLDEMLGDQKAMRSYSKNGAKAVAPKGPFSIEKDRKQLIQMYGKLLS